MSDEIKKKELFEKGLSYYKDGNYFEAHEYWEDLWSDFYLEDRKFIQGLIQLAVSFVHLENGNMNGARSLLKKSTKKFIGFLPNHRNINVKELMNSLNELSFKLETINSATEFDWTTCPKILLNE